MTPQEQAEDAVRSALHHLDCVTVEASDETTDWERIEAAKDELREVARIVGTRLPGPLPPCVCGLRHFYPGRCKCWLRPA